MPVFGSKTPFFQHFQDFFDFFRLFLTFSMGHHKMVHKLVEASGWFSSFPLKTSKISNRFCTKFETASSPLNPMDERYREKIGKKLQFEGQVPRACFRALQFPFRYYFLRVPTHCPNSPTRPSKRKFFFICKCRFSRRWQERLRNCVITAWWINPLKTHHVAI